MVDEEKLKAAMRDIAERLTVATAGKGYALFIATPGQKANYISNANRQDVVKTLEEWLQKAPPAMVDEEDSPPFTPPELGEFAERGFARRNRWATSEPKRQLDDPEATQEPPEARDARLEHERQCAAIGRVFAQIAPVVFFMFDFGPPGNLAYFTNVPNVHAGIESFVRQERGRS